jgi:hypothetical protein
MWAFRRDPARLTAEEQQALEALQGRGIKIEI